MLRNDPLGVDRRPKNATASITNSPFLVQVVRSLKDQLEKQLVFSSDHGLLDETISI
jgi:hypothetical protein